MVFLGGCLFDSRMLQTKGLSARHDAETRHAAKLMPAELHQPGSTRRGDVRTLKVRVWADSSFRQAPRWRDRIVGRFARANEFLRQALGVELEADIRVWDHGGEEVADLSALLTALVRHDPGNDVDHVVGMTGGLPRVTTVHEQLGSALGPGKHFVLRALTDAVEYQHLAAGLPTLSRSDLDELSVARLTHKETAVTVHEWAHNLGALHEDDESYIMASIYHYRASHFSDETLKRVATEIAARSTKPFDYAQAEPSSPEVVEGPDLDEELATAETLRAVDDLARRASSPEGWMAVGDAYARLGAFTRADEAYAHAGPRADGPRRHALLMRRQRGVYGVAADQEPQASAAIEKAYKAIGGGDRGDARKAIDGGLKMWPKLAGLLALRCYVEMEAGKTREAQKTCDKALVAGEDSVMAHYFSAHVAVRTGKRAAAIAHFEEAIALDADARAAYEGLGREYKAAGESAKLDGLRKAYQSKFGRSLP